MFGKKVKISNPLTKEGREKAKEMKESKEKKETKEAVDTGAENKEDVDVMKESPFVIVKKCKEIRDKFAYTESGQRIPTGEKETVTNVIPIVDIDVDDLIDIMVNCKGLPVSEKVRSVFRTD